MKDDPIQVFRNMLPDGSNHVDGLETSDASNTASTSLGGAGGGNYVGPPPGGGGGGGGGNMDAWQTSVESRLNSLDSRLTSIESGIGDLKAKLATVETDVKHLPSKGFIVSVVTGGAVLLGAVGHYLPKLLGG
jgi:hypothetical protein